MIENVDKNHLLINNNKESFPIKVGDETVTDSKCDMLLGVKVHHELIFNEHVTSLCMKANQKLNAVTRIGCCMTLDQRKLVRNSFITSHFFRYPIVCMFHSRKLNERITNIYERALKIVCKDF